ncbi:MAG: ABC transporter ATP-binding protein [Clostridiales bacterium]|nr:MAG: ABC transporter ATP-binding protein [Clostridiales bacterium]
MNLKISDLSFKYSSGKQVLDGVNFQAESGKCTFLLGANGAGKTTLFSNILGLLTPSFGKITLDDADLSSLKPREKKQNFWDTSRETFFFPSGSAFDAVLLGRRPYIRWGVTENDLSVVEKLFKDLSVEDFAMRNVDSLSGGEKQKIAIARALAQEPQVLLFDELTSNLDVKKIRRTFCLSSKIDRGQKRNYRRDRARPVACTKICGRNRVYEGRENPAPMPRGLRNRTRL